MDLWKMIMTSFRIVHPSRLLLAYFKLQQMPLSSLSQFKIAPHGTEEREEVGGSSLVS